MDDKIRLIRKISNGLMNLSHHLALLGKGAAIVWYGCTRVPENGGNRACQPGGYFTPQLMPVAAETA